MNVLIKKDDMHLKTASFSAATLAGFAFSAVHAAAPGDCIADENINTAFAQLISGGDTYEVPDGSCCQETICGLGCPEEVAPPSKGTRNRRILSASTKTWKRL